MFIAKDIEEIRNNQATRKLLKKYQLFTGQSQFNSDGTSKVTKELIDKINKDLSV